MAEASAGSIDNDYSSRLTRRLVARAEGVLAAEEFRGDRLDKQFIELVDAFSLSGERDPKLENELIRLASLTNNEDALYPVNGKFKITVSENNMMARLSVTAHIGKGKPVTLNDVIGELTRQNIRHGLLKKEVARAINDAGQGKDTNDLIIARGTAPIAGSDPWIAFFCRSLDDELMEIDEQALRGSYEDPILCKQGDAVAFIRQGSTGRSGYTVTGEPLKPPPQPNDVKLVAGKNLAKAGDCFIAQVDGAVFLKEDVLSVQKAIVFDRDVSTDDSPLFVDGSIYIHGGVKNNVVIEATDDIVVDRVVEGARITSKSANVILRVGIAGRHKGQIIAAKDVDCGYIENATVTSGHDIILHVGALNSHLTANHDILVKTGKGSIAGGTLLAGHCIQAKRLGSYGTETDIITGVSVQAIPVLEQISKKFKLLHTRLVEATVLISKFDRAVSEPRKLTPHELQTYTNLQKLRIVTEHELRQLDKQRHEILANIETAPDAGVFIYQQLEPGVHFHIGDSDYEASPTKGPLALTYEPSRHQIICKKAA